jgi:hypothetical protein
MASMLAGPMAAASARDAAGPARTQAAAVTVGKPIYAFDAGLVLTVGQKARRGTPVRVNAYAGRSGQRWVRGSHGSIRPALNQKLCLNITKFRAGAAADLWTCDGAARERFSMSAPSAHTQVYFIKPATRPGYCLSTLGGPDLLPSAGARTGVELCAGDADQAWSSASLSDAVGSIGNSWSMQALHPTSAGSAITAASTYAGKLYDYWTSSYTGATQNSPVLLHPVDDTALCAALPAPEQTGVRLTLAACDGAANQQFMGIGMFFNVAYTFSFLTTPDSSYCVQAAPAGAKTLRPVVLGSCAGNDRDVWDVGVPIQTANSGQYQELYAGTDSLEFSIRAEGSSVVLSNDDEFASQVWTDIPPGQAKAEANPDGSISLRPLSDESLCLTVPGADYAAGAPLAMQDCDGQVDQEFVRPFVGGGNTGLVAAGDGEFCITPADGLKAGSVIALEPCTEQQDDQIWTTFFAWFGWAGQGLSPAVNAAEPGDSLVLSGTGASGQVGVIASPGSYSWYTSQDWISVDVQGGFEIRSVYDPGLCLDAPDSTAGTQLGAAPCAGGAAQAFQYGSSVSGAGQWRLGNTGMCVGLGAASTEYGLPLVLQTCTASQQDQLWSFPPGQL